MWVYRKYLWKIVLTLTFFAAFICSSCSSIPIPEDIQVSIFNQAKKSIFAKKENHDSGDWRILEDEKIARYINKVGERVRRKSGAPKVNYFVVDSPIVQATSNYSDRATYFTLGMLATLQNEAELACLIGHELQHQLQFQQDPEAQTNRSSSIRNSILDHITPEALRRISISDDLDEISYANFSKERETEADEQGSIYCEKAGYDAFALADLQERLSDKVKDGLLERIRKIKGSHERLKVRAEHLREFLSAKGFTQKKGDLGTGRFQQALSRWAIAQRNFNTEQENTLRELSQLAAQADALAQRKTVTSAQIVEITQKLSQIVQREKLTDQDFRTLAASVHTTEDSFMEERVVSDVRLLQDYRFQVLSSVNETLLVLSRIGLGFVPYVGSALDLHELITGRDFFTGKKLTFADRILTALGIVVGQGANLRKLEQSLLRGLGNASEVKHVLRAASAEAKLERITKVTRFGPLNPGDLHGIKEGVGSVADTFRSGTYFKAESEAGLKLYRAYGDKTRQLTRYWSLEKPQSRLQATLDSAIDPAWGNKLSHWVEITLPKGETIYVGQAASIRPGIVGGKSAVLAGGGKQVFIEKRISDNWITNTGVLK